MTHVKELQTGDVFIDDEAGRVSVLAVCNGPHDEWVIIEAIAENDVRVDLPYPEDSEVEVICE